MYQPIPESEGYVEELWRRGCRSYSDLNPDEIDKLTGFLIREAARCEGKKWHHEFIVEANNLGEVASKLATLLINPDSKSAAENLIVAVRNGAAEYAKSFIESLFDNRHYYRRAA